MFIPYKVIFILFLDLLATPPLLVSVFYALHYTCTCFYRVVIVTSDRISTRKSLTEYLRSEEEKEQKHLHGKGAWLVMNYIL